MPRSLALAAAVGALALGSAAAMSNGPGPPGPRPVTQRQVGGGLGARVFLPADLADGERVPGVVFAKGLCGTVAVYEPLLKHLASFGMAVVANQNQEECGGFNVRKALSNPLPFVAKQAGQAIPRLVRQVAHDPVGFLHDLVVGVKHHPISYAIDEGKVIVPAVRDSLRMFNHAKDVTEMTRHTERSLEWLRAQPYVDPDNIAFVGHSLGGGVAILTAGELARAGKVGPKAVVAICPLNYHQYGEKPADVVGSIEAPVLMFCSPTDIQVPCRGSAFTVGVPPAATNLVRAALPSIMGGGMTLEGMAMEPIYDNANNAVLLEVLDGTHVAMAHIDNIGSEHNELNAALPELRSLGVPDLVHRYRPYQQLPTAHYTVEFLLDVFSNNSTGNSTAELGAVVAEADGDMRFVNVRETLGGSSVQG